MKKARIQDYVVLDVETGGLLNKAKLAVLDVALTEVAFVYVSPELEVLGTYDTLITPYSDTAEYTAKAAEISGITKADCEEGGIPIGEAVANIIEFFEAHQTGKAKPVMVGHNLIEFDSYFIENMFIMAGKKLYDYVSKKMVDTLDECHKIFPEAPDFKLGTMCGQFDIELVEAHRALPDTVANAQLWIGMLQRLRNESSGGDSAIEVERMRYHQDFKY